MFSYFKPNFIEKFLWESGFSNFGQNRNDAHINTFGPKWHIYFLLSKFHFYSYTLQG